MGIQEAIERSGNPLTIFIIKEALFCNVYEESAWRFAELISPYKPVRKRIKKLNKEIVSLGFPKTRLPDILKMIEQQGYVLEMEEPNSLTIRITREPEMDFTSWKENIPIKRVEEPVIIEKSYIKPTDSNALLEELQFFNVADHTPVESMLFIIELQNKLKVVKKMPE